MSVLEDNIKFKSQSLSIECNEIEMHESNGLDASWLTLLFSGKDFNIKLANSLRRACSNNIPTFAIPQELITIELNTSVAFNNDYMKLRLAQLPVYGLDPDLYFLAEKYWNKDTVNYADPKREKHPKEKSIEFYINSHNNSSMITNVTTNDIKMFIDGELINPYNKKYPMLLIKLRPNDRFKCHMKAVLGVGERNVIWAGARNVYYDEKNTSKNEILFTIEGNGQCHEYDTLLKACKFLIKKYTDLRTDLNKKFKSKEILPKKVIYLKLDKEDYTIAEPLNYELQDHKNIIMSGLSRPDHLVRSIQIKVESDENIDSPIPAILECIDAVTNKFMHIGYIISELKNKMKLPKKQSQPKQSRATKDNIESLNDEELNMVNKMGTKNESDDEKPKKRINKKSSKKSKVDDDDDE